MTYDKEDRGGTSPKFIARDANDVKWKGKLGVEARSETVASRIVWAVGYFTDEDYFESKIAIEGMPARLRHYRIRQAPDGSVQNVRLKRYLEGEEKAGNWSWEDNPFHGTRELNGLRVLMALINNWDLKAVNNAVYEIQTSGANGLERVYMVSDLGASFGSSGLGVHPKKSKDNLEAYRRSRFIKEIEDNSIDFDTPRRPTIFAIVHPRQFAERLHMRAIGRGIPRDHVRWIGRLLSQLSSNQIRDAFWSAGYSEQEVDEFSRVLENRIAAINDI